MSLPLNCHHFSLLDSKEVKRTEIIVLLRLPDNKCAWIKSLLLYMKTLFILNPIMPPLWWAVKYMKSIMTQTTFLFWVFSNNSSRMDWHPPDIDKAEKTSAVETYVYLYGVNSETNVFRIKTQPRSENL